MRTTVVLLVVAAALVAGCISQLNPVSMPLTVSPPPGMPIDTAARPIVNGVYVRDNGDEIFGDTIVVRWVHDRLCFYTGTQVVFAETAGALAGDTARFDGYYRFVRSVETGSVAMTILPEEGGIALRTGSASAGVTVHIVINGSTSITYHRVAPLAQSATPFHIIGHRAGGRNSERLGRSENSIAMARFSEILGCTGVETDIHVTRDGELIIFHDETFSPRTVSSMYVLGNVSDFTLRQIRNDARLLFGEPIPTVEEFLNAIIDSTTLELVWLDVKAPSVVEKIINAQRVANAHARNNGRNLKVYFGVPSQEVLDAYRAAPSANTEPVLCELAPDIARSLPTCKIWAPRWTNGLQADNVRAMQQAGYEVLTWTLDSPEYMTEFLNGDVYNGILTNYPSMLAGLYYARH